MSRIRFALALAATALACACGSTTPSSPDGGSPPVGAEGADGAPATIDAATQLAIPFAVDDWFAPSGYMGDGESPGAIEDLPVCADTRPGNARGFCHQFTWTPAGAGWGGVYWQYPDGNWGSSPGLEIPTGATEVSFYAWGETGGEVVTFMVGMADVDGFAVELEDVVLTASPTLYSLDLSATGYGFVVGGFGWVAGDSEAAVTFYLDDIGWR